MEIRESFELDEDILNSVTGGSDVHMDNECWSEGDTIRFYTRCPACGKTNYEAGLAYFEGRVTRNFKCDGTRDMLEVEMNHCGIRMTQWVDHK